MKLHLPSPLRTVLLASLALAAPYATTLATTLAVGTVALSSAYAADIYYDGGTISSWEEGTIMGDTAFHTGDNIIFQEGNTNATLGDNITAGTVRIQSGSILTLDGAGHTLTASSITLNGLLRLKSQALSTSSHIAAGRGVVEVAWGDTAGSLSSQLENSSFLGTLRVNASTYALAASNLPNASQTLEILSGSTIQAAAGTYVAAVVSEGQNTIQVSSGTATFSGEVSGNGTLTKTGAGILRFTTNLYHTGDLVINGGTVQWGNTTERAFNTMVFDAIRVNDGGTFEDSHLGTTMQHRTDVYLNNGTMSANDMLRPASGLTGLTENYYKSLHVSGTSVLNYSWKGIRRFDLLTSEGTEAVTLNISNSNEDSQTIFERIENFHGSIGGAAKNDRNRIYIGKVSQADGYAMTINHNTHSQNLNKSGAGSLTITGTLSVEDDLTLQEGRLEIGSTLTVGNNLALQAGDMAVQGAMNVGNTLTQESGILTAQQNISANDTRLSGGSLMAAALTGDTYAISGTANATHTGNVTLAEELRISTKGTVSMTNARSDGSVTIAGGTVTLRGSLTGHDSMTITGGAITAVNAVGGNFLMSGGSLSLSGNMEVDSFRLSDGNLSFTGASSALTAHKELNMNYNGSLNSASLTLNLDDGIVLSYNPKAANTIQIANDSTTSSLNRISINLLGISGSDLYNNGQGINLGVPFAYKDMLNISTLGEKGIDYSIENVDGYCVLKTYSSSTVAHTSWDLNWGNAVASAGPAQIKNINWEIVGTKPGLYNSPHYTSVDKYDTCGIISGTSSASNRNAVFGGAYGTAPIDGSGGTVDRDVWLIADRGSLSILAGGSFNVDATWNLGTANAPVDTHLLVQNSMNAVGSVIGGNVHNAATWIGDSYISIYSDKVTGSVVGGSEQGDTRTGNSHVNVYAPLSPNVDSSFTDPTRTDTQNAITISIPGSTICGGNLGGGNQTGDNLVTIDFSSYRGHSSMAKNIAGGHGGNGTLNGDSTVIIRHTGGMDFSSPNITGGNLSGGNQTGNSSVQIIDTQGSEFTTNIIAGGHGGSGSLAGNSSVVISNTGNSNFAATIIGGHHGGGSQTGNSSLTLQDTGNSSFGSLVGGHYDGGAQSLTGNANVTITGSSRGNITSITGGHRGGSTQSITGSIAVSIANGASPTVSMSVVGGHYTTRNEHDNTTQTVEGDISLDIDAGVYNGKVIAGNCGEWSCTPPLHPNHTHTSTISESVKTLIKGGTFHHAVIGASSLLCDCPSGSIIASTGGVDMDLQGGAFDSLIGGYELTAQAGGNASIGDISIKMDGITVSGTIYGGSRTNSYGGRLRQGNITLDFISGTFRGNIYAAGRDGGTGPITESTTVNIHRGAKDNFGHGIIISGGYEEGTTGTGGTTGAIVTNKTLAFVDPVLYDQASMGCTYTYFDAVNVTEGATVTLTQRLQEMEQSVTKMGKGKLKLGEQNDVDNVQVTDGTLALQGGSNGLTMIELLQVVKDATLDISAGNCGINGKLVMENGSTLAVNATQAASSLQELQWSTDGLVNISIADAPTEGNYTIELFNDRTKADGLVMESISGIEFDEMDGKYVASASDYLESTNGFSLANAYLVLREDGTLVLTNVALRSLHWAGNDGDVWNVRQNLAWAPHDDEAPSTDFLNGSNVIFTKDGSAADPMTVVVGEDVSPADMTFSQGFYEFTTDSDASIATDKRITLTEATVDMGSLLDTSEQAPSLTLVDDDSRFHAGNDIRLNKLNNNGSVTIDGNLALNRGTDNGGNLSVGGNLKLGGSSSFDVLTAQDVIGNKEYTLTTGKTASDASSIASIDGGSLIVNSGRLDITTAKNTSLASIGGAGSLTANGNLALAQASRIGNLTAPSLTLSGRLDANNTLTTSSIALDDLQLDTRQAMVAAKTMAAAGSSPIAVTVADSVVSRQVLEDGVKYYLVQGQNATAGTSFTINGQEDQVISSHRYDYHLQTEENGVSITGIVTNYHFYEDNAQSENGRTGAKMMDTLYREGADLANDPSGDIRKVLDAMDDLLVRTNQPKAADTLAAAVAGSTVPAMVMAFSGDMERQLKSIRNRTTTMGLGSECLAYEDLPYFNAWINAEGNHHELDDDATYSGYKLDSWGGTVGFDVDVSNSFTCGLAITALMGDFSASGADSLDGDLDTQYLTLFARYYRRSWVHTLVGSLGRADISYDRTVAIPGHSSYTTTGDTDGMGFGLMYEVGYAMAMNESSTVCLQPVANITLAHTSISGYEETGGNAALHVDDMNMTSLTLGAGARMQAAFGETIYNRTSLFEARALVKFIAGDRQGEADNSFAAAEYINGSVKSAELGAVGVELGAGITVPVGAEAGAIFADVAAEVQSGYTAINGTIGYRVNF